MNRPKAATSPPTCGDLVQSGTPPASSAGRQDVWTHGWSPETMRRAISALGALIVGERRDLGRPDLELAVELVRWLRWPTYFDSEDLSATLDECRPLSPDTPEWDELDALVFNEPSTARLLDALHQGYADPARTLISYLTDVAPRGRNHADVDPRDKDAVDTHRRAYELLFELGTPESLSYALSRLDLIDPCELARFVPVVQPRMDQIRACALTVWPRLTWDVRADIVRFLEGTGLADERVFHLLMGANVRALSHPERLGYLRSLGSSFDPRVVPRLYQVLDEALLDLGGPRAATAEEVVRVASAQLARLEADLTPQQVACARACGVHLEARSTTKRDAD